jgi:hypothetical protein
MASKWTAICERESTQISEQIQGDIRSACGLAHLLIAAWFTQFIELIVQCEQSNKDSSIKLVKCSDLQGFWDIVEYQVKGVNKKFVDLQKTSGL